MSTTVLRHIPITISSKSCFLPILGLLGLHNLESVNDLNVGRASGTVDVAQGLHLETHRNTRFLGTGSVHIEGFLKDRGWCRVLWRRCSESGYHEECADYREFEHFDGSSEQRGKHQIEFNYSNSSKLLFTSSPSLPRASSTLWFRLPFFRTWTLERVRRLYRHCPKESRLLPFILVKKEVRVRFWNFDGPHRVSPACRRVTTHTSYWFSSRRSFRLRRVRLSLTRLHTVGPSPPCALLCVYLCAYLVCVHNGCVLAADKPAPYVCVKRIQTHVRKNARGRGRGKKEREMKKMREWWCDTYAPLISSSGPRLNRGRHFGMGQNSDTDGRRKCNYSLGI